MSLRDEILEIIKGYETVARSDGKGGTIPAGYDLDKDGRTKFGFYWEYEDMEACADKLVALLESGGDLPK